MKRMKNLSEHGLVITCLMRSITLLSVRDSEFVDNFLRSSKDGEAAISPGLPDSQAGAQTLARDIVANRAL